MEALLILLPISLLLGGVFLFLFIMNVKKGDFDDLSTPAKRILFEEENININLNEKQGLKK
ncbi:MAG: cbb3-type cytochrome oxidase assembly protein CcoS [Halobacteriovorax sp.]|nr:cbb3-type cytochrome oxidase assembly protein CcoS [Halobacteriovorax sp.]|tara:strand:- start:178455 stop:178637 length:183 start_codon:yes stop_codon:yes gene_type:complete